MLEITNLTHGEIVNAHYGTETENGLTLEVQGIARPQDAVTVNGTPARRSGEFFSAPVTLTRQHNLISAVAAGERGRTNREISVVWDKKSFKRAAFFIDDNIFFLTEIAKTRPHSLFDQFYLKMLRELNRKYGFKVTLNLFFRNDHQPFDLSEFPDAYKAEFQDNKDWLRLAFHGYSEFPDRPYQNSKPGKLAADYDLIVSEINRFAGEGVATPPMVCHWAMAQAADIRAMKQRGVKVLTGGYLGLQTYIGEEVSAPVADIGFFQSDENSRFLLDRHLHYDEALDLTFAHAGMCCNLQDIPELEQVLAERFADPKLDAIYAMTHEQYFYPYYASYLPNHAERLETVVRLIHEHGYPFVWFNEGFLGNMVQA